MKKFLLFLLLFYPLCGQAQNTGAPAITTGMTATVATTGTGVSVPTTNYHQIVWFVSGTISTCTVAVDTSPDNSSWTAGGAIGNQTCTNGGQSALTNVVANYIRINITVLTGGGTLRVLYTGYPGSSGIVGSCATTNAIAIYTAAATSGCGNADFTYATHTLTAGAAGLLDLSAITSTSGFKVPSAAGNTAGAAGVITFDTTNKNYHGFVNGADSIFANLSAAPTTGDVVSATIASGNTLLSDTGFLATNVVRKDTTNTGAAAMTLDMSASTGSTALKPPQIAAPAPSTTPAIAFGTNQDSYFVGDSVLGASTVDRTFWVENCTTDSNCATQGASTPGVVVGTNGNLNTASTNNTTKIYFTGISIPANTILTNKLIRACGVFQFTTTAVPTLQIALNLGTTALVQLATQAPPSTTSKAAVQCATIVGTAAAGASVSVTAGFDGVVSTGSASGGLNQVAQPVAGIATNGALIISWSSTWSTNTAANTVTLISQYVQVLN